MSDTPFLDVLIEQSVMRLQAPDYSEAQRKGALGTVFGVDRQLILDETYLVAETTELLVGCGGWSRRQAQFGADALTAKDNHELNPTRDAARIRAFFIRPGWERRGIGSKILTACEDAARKAGFGRLELVATLTGVALYQAHGYRPEERFETPLPNGLTLPVVRMTKTA